MFDGRGDRTCNQAIPQSVTTGPQLCQPEEVDGSSEAPKVDKLACRKKQVEDRQSKLVEVTLQAIVVLLTIEAEYMAVTKAVKEAIWSRGLFRELIIEEEVTIVYYDSQSAIHLHQGSYASLEDEIH
ncbi:hypothetical protein CRG98_001068 [Punica granatum]|uniref:Uncharacterized protein n=1 Tax=Punica granatum TaxID=22663 RepID=A0A2I0LCX7_PUNGR|nr:hypothetical protein CRG98_001068 [Punica granatum]